MNRAVPGRAALPAASARVPGWAVWNRGSNVGTGGWQGVRGGAQEGEENGLALSVPATVGAASWASAGP